ncbi:MAG TPA: hypothetical protein VM889_08790 [Candidatus Thermoplasmatota archaeon]|nr:hypothetical protein [Candidatus Thermoplasmatota archaeon]
MKPRLHALYVIVATLSLVAGVGAPMLLGSTTYAAVSASGSASATFRVDIPTERECAIWAGADLEIRGSRNRFDQCAHANDDVFLRGGDQRFRGSVRYVDAIDSNNNGHVLERGADKVAAAPAPVSLALADYAPGGRAAIAAGSSYHLRNSSAVIDAGALAAGLHYVDGDVVVRGAQSAVAVTLVAKGRITIESHDLRLTPFVDGLVLGAWRASGNAIEVQSDRGVYDGLLYAASANLQVAGGADGNTFSGKLVAGQNVAINGDDNVVAV